MYNAPVDYVNLLLHGDVRGYLKNVTEYRGFLLNISIKMENAGACQAVA